MFVFIFYRFPQSDASAKRPHDSQKRTHEGSHQHAHGAADEGGHAHTQHAAGQGHAVADQAAKRSRHGIP